MLAFLHGRPCRFRDLQNGPLRAFYCKMADAHRGNDALCACLAGPAWDRRRSGPTVSDT